MDTYSYTGKWNHLAAALILDPEKVWEAQCGSGIGYPQAGLSWQTEAKTQAWGPCPDSFILTHTMVTFVGHIGSAGPRPPGKLAGPLV